MNLLTLSVIRELKAARWRSFSIVAIVSIGVAVTVGLYASMDSLFHTRDLAYQKGNLADLEVRFQAEDDYNIPSLKDLKGIASTEERLIMPGVVPVSETKRLPALIHFIMPHWPQRVNGLTIIEGKPPDFSRDDWMMVERSMAEYYDLNVGDTLTVRSGYKTYTSTITAIVFSPEFLMTATSGNFLVPQKGALGVLYTPMTRFSKPMGYTMVNSLAFTFKPGMDKEVLRRRIMDRLTERLHVEDVIPKEEQFSTRWLTLDLKGLGGFIPVIIIIFGLIGGLATFITFSRLILSRRREIGTTMALGYTRRKIIAAYGTGALILAVIAFAIGIIGALAVRSLFVANYANAIGLYQTTLILPPSRIFQGLLYALVTTGIATGIAFHTLFRLTPLKALRPVVRREQFLRSLSKSRRWTTRYALRNLTRHRFMVATTILCISLSLSAVIAYCIAFTSMDRTLQSFFSGYPWDMIVDFHTHLWPEDVRAIASTPGIRRWEVRVKGHVTYISPHGEYDSSLIGVPSGASLILPPQKSGKSPNHLEGHEVVLETVLAKKLHVEPGDSMTMKFQRKRWKVRVAGICSGISGQTSFSTLPFSREILDIGQMSSVLIIQAERGIGLKALAHRLLGNPDVAYVTLQSDMAVAFKNLMKEFWSVLYVAILLSTLVAVIFIITTLLLTVIEREGEFSTLRVVGVELKACFAILTHEALVQMLLSILIAIPLSLLIASYLGIRISDLWFDLHLTPSPGNYLLVIVPALLMIPISVIPSYRYIKNLDLSKSIRTRMME